MRRKKRSSKISRLREWFNAVIFAVVVASSIRWLIIEFYTVPTSSMEQTIVAGDYILVSKLHYGARTPKTLLQIPLFHQTIGHTVIPSYLDWIQLPYYRLPSYTHVKRGDQVVFNYPMEQNRPIDQRTYYIKRCVGLPGDEIHIRDAQFYINGEPQLQHSGLQYCYYLKTNTMLQEKFFHRNAIREYQPVQEGYLVQTTPAIASQLEQIASIQKVQCMVTPIGIVDPQIYPSSTDYPWNTDQFGPVTVPAKGMIITINRQNLVQYERVITYHEGHKNVQIDDEQQQLWIDGQQVTSYTFRQDYYFMVGDNRHNSLDSRFWSFLPQDHLVGKAILVLFSLDHDKHFLHKIRWERFFKPL